MRTSEWSQGRLALLANEADRMAPIPVLHAADGHVWANAPKRVGRRVQGDLAMLIALKKRLGQAGRRDDEAPGQRDTDSDEQAHGERQNCPLP